MKTAIFDIDGTLGNCDHRLHHIKTKPKNWKAFNAGYLDDTIHKPVWDVMRALSAQYHIVVLTGREGSEQGTADTVEWLKRHGAAFYDKREFGHTEICISDLFMRPYKDYRPDYDVKEEALHRMRALGYDPIIAFEDRPLVIEMWKKNGLYVFNCDQSITKDNE